jgi:hypothetical protein
MNPNQRLRSSTIAAFACLAAACGPLDEGELETYQEESALDRGDTVGTTPIPLAPPQLALVNAWSIDRVTGLVDGAQKINGKWQTSYPFDDVPPSYVHLVYSPSYGMTNDAANAISTSNLWVTVNGHWFPTPLAQNAGYNVSKVLNAAYACPSGKVCVSVDLSGTEFYSLPPPWTVWIQYWNATAVAWQSVTTTIYPSPLAGNYFDAAVLPTFQTGPCITCHSLNTPTKLVAHHQKLVAGVGAASITLKQGAYGSVMTCSTGNCHDLSSVVPWVAFIDTEWKAPYITQANDWELMDSKSICAKVKATLPTAAKQNEHFFGDKRIAWAVDSGLITPFNLYVPKAYPYSYIGLQSSLTPWINAGAPCPK